MSSADKSDDTSTNALGDSDSKSADGEPEVEIDDNDVKVFFDGRIKLKRELGLISCTSIIIGTVIGSGIFISPKSVLRNSGSIALSLIVWGFTGVLSMMGAICYAELSTLITKSGGEYTYLKAATFNVFGYLWVWTLQNLAFPSATAIKALVFAEYLSTVFPNCSSPETMKRVIAAVCVVTAYLSVAFSTKMAARIMVLTVIAKVAACIIIAIGGIVMIAQGTVSELPTGFDDTTTDPSLIALSFYSAYFAYAGWDQVTRVTEEVKNPRRNLPLSLFLGLGIVTVLYVLMNVSYLSVMTKAELLEAGAVGVVWGDRVLGSFAIIIPIAVAISTFGSNATGLFGISRSGFAAARDGNFPEVLSYIQVHRNTPIVSMTWLSLLCLILLIPGEPGRLINILGWYSSLFETFVFASLLILRWRRPKAPRIFKAPLPIAIFMVLWSAYLCIAPLTRDPEIELLYGLASIGVGLVLYVPFVYLKWKLWGTDTVTMFIQLVFNVAPAAHHEE